MDKARLVANSLDRSASDLYNLRLQDTVTMLLENESVWGVFNPRFNIHEHNESLLDYRKQSKFMQAHLRLPAVYHFLSTSSLLKETRFADPIGLQSCQLLRTYLAREPKNKLYKGSLAAGKSMPTAMSICHS